jgi:predicted GNAT superfamily acetyltransferase
MSSPSVSEPVITVRPVASPAEYHDCQEIQRRAWGITEEGYVVPVATMISVQHAGGLVLGAFDGERLVGFAFAYLGRVRGRWALYSQLAGVDPSVQAGGIGGRLKLAQRAWAKEQGLDLVAWSFDPLQAGNANFNLHRLGACSVTYQVNYFGERSDALNAGLDTDRLLVEWPVDDHPIRWQDEVIEIDIPPNLAGLKERDPARARAWQLRVREAFQRAFAAGYVAMDFGRGTRDDGPRAWYILRRPLAAGDPP